MKNSHRCPKCGGEDIIRCKTAVNGAYDKIQTGIFSTAETDRWVCCACGYCELWVDEEALENVRRFWKETNDSYSQRS